MEQRPAPVLRHRRLETPFERPVRGDVVEAVPVADRQAGEVRGAERGRLGDDRPLHRDAEEVRLELEEQVIDRGAAIDAEDAESRVPESAAIASRTSATWNAIDSSVARAISGEARAARQPDERATRIRIPVRRAEPGERGHEVDAARVRDRGGERLDVAGFPDRVEAVAQPLHGRPG